MDHDLKNQYPLTSEVHHT